MEVYLIFRIGSCFVDMVHFVYVIFVLTPFVSTSMLVLISGLCPLQSMDSDGLVRGFHDSSSDLAFVFVSIFHACIYCIVSS